MLHATILSEGSGSEDRHNQRAFGRFYTPESVAAALASSVIDAWNIIDLTASGVDCIDPFCGDGRLIVALMNEAHRRQLGLKHWRVTLWDADPAAVGLAKENVTACAATVGASVAIRASTADAFLQSSAGHFDAVVTNPPWEALKPDRREMIHMTAEQKQSYVDALRQYDAKLAGLLPLSQPSRKFSGWGTNLSRCGLELAMHLCRPATGTVGIVMPASTLSDQTTTSLRASLFTRFAIRRVAHYPAEAKLFAGVDQAFVTITAVHDGPTTSTVIDRYGRNGLRCDSVNVRMGVDELGANGFRLPCDTPSDLLRVLLHLSPLPSVGSFEGRGTSDLWMGRELDETGYMAYTSSNGVIPFVKGRAIGRYRAPESHALYLNDSERPLPPSVVHTRIAWRDVSRRSQRRRVQATVLPGGVVTGNSLHVAYFRDDDEDRLLAVLALLNSLPVELQVRAGLGTGHVSLGAVRSVRIPPLTDQSLIANLARLARLALTGDEEADSKLESLIGSLYGIDAATLSRIEQFCSNPYFDCEQ